MARLWHTGFEQQTVTSGLEWDTTVGSPTINTTIKRTGSASLRCNPTAATAFMQHQLATGSTAAYYTRFYLYIATATNALDTIFAYRDGSTNNVEIAMNSNRTLELHIFGAQAGSDSAALSTGTWYRIEVKIAQSGSPEVEALIDGVAFASGSMAGSLTANVIRVGPSTATTCDLYFDDVAVNDTTGSVQNSYPGEGGLYLLRPNDNGDQNSWQKSTGAAGSSTNFDDVNELTPDDASSYLTRTSGQPLDEYDLEAYTTVGGGATDDITLVSVGVRAGSNATTVGTNRAIRLQLQTQDAGTTVESGDIDISVNGYTTQNADAPRLYNLVSYVDPQNGGPWTVGLLADAQVGVRAAASSTTVINVSAVWVYVEGVPSSAQTVEIDHIASTTTLNAPTAAPGAVTLEPPTIASTTTLNAPTVSVGAVTLTLPHIASTTALNAPTVSTGAVTVTLPHIASTTVLYEPTVATDSATLELPHIASVTALNAPTVTPGVVTLSLPHIASTTTLNTPSLALNLLLPLIASTTTLNAPTVTTGAVALVLPHIASTTTLNVPVVTAAGTGALLPHIDSTTTLYTPSVHLNLTLPLIASTTTLHAFTVTPGGVTVTLPHIASVTSLNVPTVVPNQILLLPHIASTTQLYAWAFVVEDTLALPHIASTTELYPFTLFRGQIMLTPTLDEGQINPYQHQTGNDLATAVNPGGSLDPYRPGIGEWEPTDPPTPGAWTSP